MASITALLESIQTSASGLTLAELLVRHPGIPRRTAQRWIQQLIRKGGLQATGQGRARRYLVSAQLVAADNIDNAFPGFISLSADSRDILAYIDQRLEARKPVGYQQDFLDAYEPDRTWYLSEPLRRQLKRIGDTGQTGLPAGTHGRAILSRLLIDLSWASSHLEGNTYTRLDTRELIEHGKAAQG
jgi:hypothetical protein